MLTDIEGINLYLNAACGEENVARIDRVTASSESSIEQNN